MVMLMGTPQNAVGAELLGWIATAALLMGLRS